MRSSAIITIPNSATRRGCPPTSSPRPSTPESGRGTSPTYLDRIDNTVQHSWLMEIARTFHGFRDDRITPGNIDKLYDRRRSRG